MWLKTNNFGKDGMDDWKKRLYCLVNLYLILEGKGHTACGYPHLEQQRPFSLIFKYINLCPLVYFNQIHSVIFVECQINRALAFFLEKIKIEIH